MLKTDTETADSYYEFSRNLNLAGIRLDQDLDVDVVVIGGGLTGCSTALHLAQSGLDVALLEGRHIGWGASGRSGGQIINGYSCEQETLEKMLGTDSARELWDHSVKSVEYTRQLVDAHEIECDLTMGYMYLGVRPKQAKELKAHVEDLEKNYGYEVLQYFDRNDLKAVIGSELYSGGVFDPGSGHLHPLNYCLGLANAAEKAGVSLFQNSMVNRVTSVSGKKVVHCNEVKITCDSVVYACNAYIDDLVPDISKRIMPVGTYIVATEPLSEEVATGLISNRAAICDTNFVLDYYRLSADNRLLFGGRVSYSTLEPRKLTESMRKRMLRVFPQLSGVKIEFTWGGYVAITQNRAPHVGRTKNGSWFAHGYSGHGMALTGYMGKILSDAINGNMDAFSSFADITHRAFPGGRLMRTPALVAAMAYYKLKDRL